MIKKKIDYSTKKILITDFSTSKLSNDTVQDKVKCESLYNFNIEDGMLKKKMGVGFLKVYAYNDSESVQYRLNTDALGLSYYNKVMHFKQYFPESGDTTHRLLIHGSDGKLYLYQMFSNLNTPNWAYELQFENIPAVLEYKKDGLDSILISAKDKLVVWSTGRTPYEITGIPTITSMCVCNDELFCTIAGESDKIWYTSNLDPESLGAGNDEAKYIIMEGSAGDGRKIVKLKENMFVFCDYGIGRVNTYAKEEPTYNQIYLTNSQIRPETVEVCGDCVMFLTRNGLYKFNGTSVTKIDVVDSLFNHKEMFITAGIFASIIVVMYLVRKLRFEFVFEINIVLGAVLNILGFLLANLKFDIEVGIGGVILGTIGSMILVFIVHFFRMVLDYTSVEYVQFEDDDYYYYVKAVPKIDVAIPSKNVTTFSNEEELELEEDTMEEADANIERELCSRRLR